MNQYGSLFLVDSFVIVHLLVIFIKNGELEQQQNRTYIINKIVGQYSSTLNQKEYVVLLTNIIGVAIMHRF